MYRTIRFTLRSHKPYVKKTCVHNDKFSHFIYSFSKLSVFTWPLRVHMIVRNVSENISNHTGGLNVRMLQDIFWVIRIQE
jgi:hypothetical protein